jgi:hypothetical protein
MDTSALMNIRTIVNKARQRGNIPENKDAIAYGLVIEGMKYLSLFNLPQKNSVKVSFDDLGRVKLPSDCLRFLSLSVPVKGRDYCFTRDKALVTTSTKTYSYEAYDTEYGEGEDPKDNFSITYVKGAGSEVRFTVNERLRYLQIVGFKGNQATLHYVSSGVSESAEGVEIPKVAENALIAYVLWRISEYDTTLSVGERQFREQKFYNESEDLDAIHYMPTRDQIMDEYYSHLYQTVKRI